MSDIGNNKVLRIKETRCQSGFQKWVDFPAQFSNHLLNDLIGFANIFAGMSPIW